MTKQTEALTLALEALEICSVRQEHQYYGLQLVSIAKYAIKEALAQPQVCKADQQCLSGLPCVCQPEERNFCSRCGKRLASGFVEISIHTCTPPKENT